MAEHFQSWQSWLGELLTDVEANDTNYDMRYRLLLVAFDAAGKCGYPVGFRFDPESPEWPVAYIELPTGQVSWHLPQHPTPWDGHTTAEKYARIRAFAAQHER